MYTVADHEDLFLFNPVIADNFQVKSRGLTINLCLLFSSILKYIKIVFLFLVFDINTSKYIKTQKKQAGYELI